MIRAFLKTPLAIIFLLAIIQITANATTFPINVTLSGAQEVPPNSSTGTATLIGTYNDSSNVLKYTVTFSGLSSNTTAAHFHAPAPPGISAPVVVPAVGFPTGVTSGTYTDSIVLSSGAEDTLKMGLWYFNIHTTNFPAGELRAQIFLQSASFVLPHVHCPADTTVSNTAGLCSASVAFSATDTTGKPASTLFYRIGNKVITSPFVFPVGVTTVLVTSVNAAGVDSCHFTVAVRDTQPPVITCPANITKPNDPGLCGATVTFAATATDNCSTHVTLSYDHAPGSFFDVGVTTVTATATDSSGNKSTCSFTITVNDVEPPVIHDLSASTRTLWPPNHKLKDVTINYTTTDNCPGPITCHLTVTSNEPDNGHGDGNTTHDWVVIDDHHIQVRAERSGNGSGRIYTTTVGCTDQHGNTASATTTISTPHSVVDIKSPGHGDHGNHTNIAVLNEEDPDRSTLVQVFPNPSRNYFTINIATGNTTDKILIRVMDIAGRVLEVKNNLVGDQAVTIGNNLKAGLYFVEIRQGGDAKQFKLLKEQ
jgi:hypothetical protein